MMKGIICKDATEYRSHERAIHKALKNIKAYNSRFYCGGSGVPDIFTTNDEPIVPFPKHQGLVEKVSSLGLPFVDIDESLIKTA